MFTKKNFGFTVIEAVVAVFVVAIALVAIITLISRTMSNTMSTRDTIVAASLAQEGAELVRNLRDNNLAGGNLPFAGFPAGDNNNCRISYSAGTISCPGSAGDFGLYYSTSGFFNHNNSGTATKYKRKIKVDYDGADPAASTNVTVESIVIWGDAWPTDTSGCNTASRCAFTRAMLKKR